MHKEKKSITFYGLFGLTACFFTFSRAFSGALCVFFLAARLLKIWKNTKRAPEKHKQITIFVCFLFIFWIFLVRFIVLFFPAFSRAFSGAFSGAFFVCNVCNVCNVCRVCNVCSVCKVCRECNECNVCNACNVCKVCLVCKVM